MRRRLLAAFFAFAVVAVIALEVPLGLALAANARTSAVSELETDGSSLGLLVGAALQRRETADAQALITSFAAQEHAVVVVQTAVGTMLAAGEGADEERADPTTRRIVAAARSGRITGEEGSSDPDDDFLYVALPIDVKAASGAGGSFGAVLLVAQPAGPMHSHIAGDWLRLALFGLGVLAVAAAAGTLLARSLTRTLGGIDAALASFGAGNFSVRAPAGRGPAEFVALARTVNEMAERLEELLHTQRAFVADASHQLRTPMTALRLRLENLEGEVARDLDPDVAAGALGPAIAEADRLSRVVDGLLALARTDGTRPAREPVDVAAVLRERVDAWGALADERRVRLVASPDGPLLALAGPGYLEQVLDNLLSNALDATPEGGTVSLAAAREGDEVEIHVVDTGPGMSAEERARAFDRFWRKEGASHDGAGLGLAIVAQLVRASGGTTRLDAAAGGGLDAVVRLGVA